MDRIVEDFWAVPLVFGQDGLVSQSPGGPERERVGPGTAGRESVAVEDLGRVPRRPGEIVRPVRVYRNSDIPTGATRGRLGARCRCSCGDLHAFYREHQRCGELDGGVEGEVVVDDVYVWGEHRPGGVSIVDKAREGD